jgi:hypothetical protein
MINQAKHYESAERNNALEALAVLLLTLAGLRSQAAKQT